MTDAWYEIVEAGVSLTQGDIIFRCPLLTWKNDAVEENLKEAAIAIEADILVITQACDLENSNVTNIALCAHWALSAYRDDWELARQAQGKTKKDDAWRSHCDSIRNGYVWSKVMLNGSDAGTPGMEHRIVDFLQVYTLPRLFLESLVAQRGESRFRLRSPYREHVSQAFARFFMRVGLPVVVSRVW
jgi:hypothetical protein